MTEQEPAGDGAEKSPGEKKERSPAEELKVPERLKKFPTDASRGDLPIFYTVRTDASATPFFTQVDWERREECIVNHKCGICGENLGGDVVCVGEADDRTAQRLTFVEAPETACHRSRPVVRSSRRAQNDPASSGSRAAG